MSGPKRGDRLPVEVTGLDDEGVGIAQGPDPRRPVRVLDGLPGERGEARVLHVGRRLLVRMVDREGAAPERRAPPCPRWTPASPCRIMHLTPPAQAAFLAERVRRALAAEGLGAVPVEGTVASPQTLGWRARATYVFARKAGRPILGAYRRGTHLVQDMAGCPLEERALAAAAAALRDALEAADVPPAFEDLPVAADDGCGAPLDPAAPAGGRGGVSGAPRPDGLRYVVLRSGAGGEVVAALLSESGRVEGVEAAARLAAEAFPRLVGVFTGRTGPGDVIFGPGALVPLAGARPLRERFGGRTFTLSPRSFFQVNRGAAEVLHALAADAAGAGTVVDVYCGAGALTLRLAARAEAVVGIESVAAAVDDARRSAQESGVTNVRFVAADAARGLEALAEEGLAPDAVVLNPPRKGVAPEVLGAVARLSPARLVYVSCDPGTLARDLAGLAGRGYATEGVTPLDLFPQSEHVESIATLRRR